MPVLPMTFDADGFKNLNDAEDFLDSSDSMKDSTTGIKKGGHKKTNGGVFGSIDSNFAAEFFATANAKTLRD